LFPVRVIVNLPIPPSGSGAFKGEEINVKKLAIAFSLCAVSMFAGEWKGTIGDSKCAAKHADASEKSMKCAQACVKGGAQPVMIVGENVYKIANPEKVTDHVGHKVTVTGNLSGDTITVDSVSM